MSENTEFFGQSDATNKTKTKTESVLDNGLLLFAASVDGKCKKKKERIKEREKNVLREKGSWGIRGCGVA